MFLLRSQYDWLVRNRSEWMATRYTKFTRRWSIRGVEVIGSAAIMEELRSHIAAYRISHQHIVRV